MSPLSSLTFQDTPFIRDLTSKKKKKGASGSTSCLLFDLGFEPRAMRKARAAVSPLPRFATEKREKRLKKIWLSLSFSFAVSLQHREDDDLGGFWVQKSRKSFLFLLPEKKESEMKNNKKDGFFSLFLPKAQNIRSTFISSPDGKRELKRRKSEKKRGRKKKGDKQSKREGNRSRESLCRFSVPA